MGGEKSDSTRNDIIREVCTLDMRFTLTSNHCNRSRAITAAGIDRMVLLSSSKIWLALCLMRMNDSFCEKQYDKEPNQPNPLLKRSSTANQLESCHRCQSRSE